MLGSKLDHFSFIKRHVVRETNDYFFEIDEYQRGADQLLLAGITFFRFTPSVLKQMLREWDMFRSCVKAPLYVVGYTDDAKWERFIKRLGFVFLQTVVCNNGETRRLFISTVRLDP